MLQAPKTPDGVCLAFGGMTLHLINVNQVLIVVHTTHVNRVLILLSQYDRRVLADCIPRAQALEVAQVLPRRPARYLRRIRSNMGQAVPLRSSIRAQMYSHKEE